MLLVCAADALAGDRRPSVVVHGLGGTANNASVNSMIGNAPAVWPTPQADQFVAGVMGDDAPGKRGVKPNGEELVAWVERQLAPGGIWADWADRGGVNILAYSKGGLDARYAYSKSYGQGKRIFKRVAMIATPNAGSNLANWACRYGEAKILSLNKTWFIPVVGGYVGASRAAGVSALKSWIQGNWGRCRDYRDALYTLRPTWVAGFNRDVHYPRVAGPGVIANPARAGTRGGGNGGAIALDGNHYTLTLRRTRIEDNLAREGGGGIFFVSNDRTGTATLIGSRLRRNRSLGFETRGLPGVFFLGARPPRLTGGTRLER